MPFVWFGRDVRRDGGLDCMGLFLEMQRRMGRDAFDPNVHPDLACAQYEIVEDHVWAPADGLWTRAPEKELGGHMSFYLGDGVSLQAVEGPGVCERHVGEMTSIVEIVYRWKGN